MWSAVVAYDSMKGQTKFMNEMLKRKGKRK